MNYLFRNITIRTGLRPGDLGYVIYLHGSLYGQEYQYSIAFETYVAKGMYEFYAQYDPEKDRVWICEDNDRIVGFLLGMHRDNQSAQLRYFILLPQYRGIGLGKKLMELYMEFLREKNYRASYLWTTHEQGTAAYLYKKFGFELTRILRLRGFINSTPGYKGGYVLARPTSDIVIKDVLIALGGPLFDAKFCNSHSGIMKLCTNSVDCSARSLWQMIQFTVNQLLEKVTLYDLVSGEKESENILKELLMNSSRTAVEKLLMNQM